MEPHSIMPSWGIIPASSYNKIAAGSPPSSYNRVAGRYEQEKEAFVGDKSLLRQYISEERAKSDLQALNGALQGELQSLLQQQLQRREEKQKLQAFMMTKRDSFISHGKAFQAAYDKCSKDNGHDFSAEHSALSQRVFYLRKQLVEMENTQRVRLQDLEAVIDNRNRSILELRKQLKQLDRDIDAQQDCQVEIGRLQANIKGYAEERAQVEESVAGLCCQLPKIEADVMSTVLRLQEQQGILASLDSKLREVVELSEAFGADIQGDWSTTPVQAQVASTTCDCARMGPIQSQSQRHQYPDYAGTRHPKSASYQQNNNGQCHMDDQWFDSVPVVIGEPREPNVPAVIHQPREPVRLPGLQMASRFVPVQADGMRSYIPFLFDGNNQYFQRNSHGEVRPQLKPLYTREEIDWAMQEDSDKLTEEEDRMLLDFDIYGKRLPQHKI